MEHLIVHCATGRETRVPLTAEELAAQAHKADAAATRADAEQKRIAADRAAVSERAAADPAFAALARLLGLDIPA